MVSFRRTFLSLSFLLKIRDRDRDCHGFATYYMFSEPSPRAMQQFNFKVVNAVDPDEEVPIIVAGQIMVDVQNLLTDVGELMVRQELRTQRLLPDGVRDRFSLKMQGYGGASGSRGDSTLLEDALSQLCIELDRANLASTIPQETSNHIEAAGRKRIASDVLALAKHLEGYILTYGSEGAMRKFRMNARQSLEKEAAMDLSAMPSAVIGVISRDPEHSNRWLISSGEPMPISFADSVDRSDILSYPGFGPLIAVGNVVFGDDGEPCGIKEVTSCYMFPSVRFHRIITPERDLLLLNPVEACPSYNADKKAWVLTNEDLGIDVSKPSWDSAVASFHEYLMFLWETYAESDDEFEGEEKEIRDLLKSYAFP